jgi:intermediate filament protein if
VHFDRLKMASTEEDSSSSTKRTTTTTYETRTTYDGSDSAGSPGLAYRASVSPRSIVIQRTSSSLGPGGAQGGRSSSSSRNLTIDRHYGPPAGAYALVTSTGVGAVKQSREQEKKDMQGLNERFASYIEKVRFLEAQNKKLADELEKLKGRWGKEYQAELDEARRLLDEGDKEKARLEIRVASLEEQLQETRQKLVFCYTVM